jgi:acyl carrier protein
MTRHEIEQSVIDIVAAALDVDRGTIQLHSSLIDDLGAESIDFVDILFRLERCFDVTIPEDAIWRASTAPGSPEEIAREVARLRSEMPAFNWNRLSDPVRPEDLPRLITVHSIVEYLARRFEAEGRLTPQ